MGHDQRGPSGQARGRQGREHRGQRPGRDRHERGPDRRGPRGRDSRPQRFRCRPGRRGLEAQPARGRDRLGRHRDPRGRRGATYVHTGSSNITYTLPAASGQDAVPNGWEIVVSNQGAGDLTIDGHGSDTIDGEAKPGHLGQRAGRPPAEDREHCLGDHRGHEGRFRRGLRPHQGKHLRGRQGDLRAQHRGQRRRRGLRARLRDGRRGRAQRQLHRGGQGQGGGRGDKKAWRLRIGAWHLSVTANSTLPAVTNFNAPDGVLLGQSGDTTVQFADISDRSTMITEGVAGDLMLIFGRGWGAGHEHL